jgi:hypothetical protein
MSDLIEKILSYLPKYFVELAQCAVAPKRFFAGKTKTESALTDALLFVGVTYALLAVVPTPYLHQKNAWGTVTLIAVRNGIGLAILIPVFRFIWFVFGARGSSPAFFAIYLYQSGVLSIIGMLFTFIAFGYLFWANPDLAHTVASLSRKGQPLPDEYFKRDDVIIFGMLQVLGIAIAFGWLSGAYGAYRQLFGLGRGRSTVVAMVTLVLLVPSYFLLVWITAAAEALFEADAL